MRKFLHALLIRCLKAVSPKPDYERIERDRVMAKLFAENQAVNNQRREAYMEMVNEMAEAVQMAGSGPWTISPETVRGTQQLIASARDSFTNGVPLRESDVSAIGAFGDLSLMLQNAGWIREISLSWMEFSRWGIQQVILISRLYWMKNPIIRRLIDIAAIYVWGRGYEVTSPDEDANATLKAFFEDNKATLGQIALMDLERRKYYDGNLFFAFFTDRIDTGSVKVRTIDATEMQEIVTDPNDSDTPWFYRRMWTEQTFNVETGATATENKTAWYPALNYNPAAKPETIGSNPVIWNTPILHRKCGQVAKWRFGCPLIYPALDWAKAARNFLEHIATVKKALSQIAMTITSKGGQQAIEGIKQQLQTTVGPQGTGGVWDLNPPGPSGSTFASGPGTQLAAFNTKGAGGDPEEVRRYLLMCCMVVGVPETFLGDIAKGAHATAQTLDRPTELVFMEKQEAWREDLATIAKFVLEVSAGAPSGMLREALKKRKLDKIAITEAARVSKNGRFVYEAAAASNSKIEVMVTFPAILEGDLKVQMEALVLAATAGNSQGQFVGIDEKTFVAKACEIIDIEDGAALAEDLYPKATYDLDRTKEPKVDPAAPPVPAIATPATEAVHRLARAVELYETANGVK